MQLSLKDRLQQAEAWLLDSPRTGANIAERFVREVARLIYAVVRDIVQGTLTLHAMGLVYTTMLSIVPMLALSFSVLKAFEVQDRFTPMLYGFFEPMGDKGIEIYNSVLGFIENINGKVLGIFGFIVLFYTVVSLVQKIERAFNTIWFAPELRSFSQRFSNYLTMVLIGPALMVSALSVTASTMNSDLVQNLMAIEPFGTAIFLFSKFMPFFMIIGAFTFFYVLMPNTRVEFKSALVGGVVAGSAWQTVSIMFTSFVVSSSQYDAIYSGFAVGILLLIWLYVNWLIMLLGSSIAFYHQHSNHITREHDVKSSPELLEALGVDVMLKIARRFEEGGKPLSQVQIERANHVPAILTREAIDKLMANGLVIVAGDKATRLSLGRSSDKISLGDIYHALRKDDLNLVKNLEDNQGGGFLLADVQNEINEKLSAVTLRDMISVPSELEASAKPLHEKEISQS